MQNNPILEDDEDDLVVLEARQERAIVGMQGQYTLGGWRDDSGRPREFTCRVLKMSSGTIKLTGPVTGSVGKWVVVHFESFGQFEGPVIHAGERNFTVRIVTTEEDRKKISSKIEWVVDKKSPDKRRHDRFVPRNPHSTLSFADGHVIPCQIIDYSASGVAASADVIPELGVVLKVGKILGRVVRRLPEGFAVKFLTIQDLRTIEGLFTEQESNEIAK